MKKNNTISVLARTALLLSTLVLTGCHTPLDVFPGPGPDPVYKGPVQDRVVVTRQHGRAAVTTQKTTTVRSQTMHKAAVTQGTHGQTVSKHAPAATANRAATTYTKKVTTTQTTTTTTPALIAPPTVQ